MPATSWIASPPSRMSSWRSPAASSGRSEAMPVLARSRTYRRRDYHPLWQLTLARFREFLREPDAVFWTFFFPIMLAVALGLAFRNRGADPVYVAVLRAPGADSI